MVITPAKEETEEERKRRLEPLVVDRMRKRDEWNAFWKIFDLESRGRLINRYQYYFWRIIDKPVTLWREKVIEPLQDKYGHWPYYHRKFRRVPTVDECHVNDPVCYHEAQQQYRLDKLVDNKILEIVRARADDCMSYHNENMLKCLQQFEDFEEAELNWYIKYGELGDRGDVLSCYMKQKHRLIWERRHPEIMAERQKAYEEHKQLLNQGIYDYWFWKRGSVWMYKDHMRTQLHGSAILPYSMTSKDEETVSLDPEYYKQRQEKKGETKLASPYSVFP